MEGVSLALSAAQTLLTALQCPDLKEMASFFKYKSHLDELQNTVSTVKAVLLDAETKPQLSNETQNYIQKLKDAVYDADDLLDEFVTIAQQKHLIQDGKVSEKVRHFFSRFNPLTVASKMSKRVKKIKNKLEGIANDHNKFGLGVDYQPIRNRRDETCSYVYKGSIIGRQDDVEKIVGILLDSNIQQDVSVLSIVGIGGLGKTALAQLLFNDERVIGAFPKRLWTCVSDHEQEQLDIDGILQKILTSATGKNHEGLPKEEVIMQLRGELANNKYLLVLDDVWTENRSHWLNLVEYLLGGQRASWMVVTTRSEETARIIGSNAMHKLQGLSEDNSWNLFKTVVFGLEQTNPPDDLVTIGKKIVKGCAGIPLALRVVGSLLYGQDKSKWISVNKMGLANVRESQTGIMPILMISYHNLESSLKSCFSYCALFPKDFEIPKDVLLRLWMAQGYVVSLDGGSSKEEVAEDYFSILLRRCFFQDVQKKDSTGEIYSCKIHDLMHDLAQKVAAKEIFVSNSFSDHIEENVRHLAHFGRVAPKYSLTNKTHLRSFVQLIVRNFMRDKVKMDQHNLEALVEKFTFLRVLHLSDNNVDYLPKAIGNLLHLRYLNISKTDLVKFPGSFTKLYNLETLILYDCCELEELPKDISKLVKLRVLSARCCTRLTEVPSDLVKLTNLRVLDMKRCGGLTSVPSDLGNLGELQVLSLGYCNGLTKMPRGLNKLTNLKSLAGFTLREASPSCKEWFDHLEELKALSNLKGRLHFAIESPKNSKIECRGGGYLKNKKSINCVHFQFFTEDVEIDGTTGDTEEILMEALEPHYDLKKIKVWGYHGVRMPSWTSSLSNLVTMELRYCDDLQELTCLGYLHNLKDLTLEDLPYLEYITEKHIGDDLQLLCLSQLESLRIDRCPELKNFPLCPKVKLLTFFKFNEELEFQMVRQRDEVKGESMSIPKLREVEIRTDNMKWLKSQSNEFFELVTSLVLWADERVESWEAMENGMTMTWHSLRHLKLASLREMQTLPNWMRCLCDSLESLVIWNCEKLETIPPWMSQLTSLKDLQCNYCSPKLKERCQKPAGEYWPYIQHIPRITFDYSRIQG